MSKNINIVLITILVCVTVWSIYTRNWNVLVANICIISGVFIEEKTTKLLMQENVNFVLIRKIQKIVVPTLYAIGAISLILLGYSRVHN
jgi:hypothetical protein